MMAAFSIPQFKSSVPNVVLYLSDVLAHASMFLTPFATSSYMCGLFIRLRLCLVFCLDNKNHRGRTLIDLFAFCTRFDLN